MGYGEIVTVRYAKGEWLAQNGKDRTTGRDGCFAHFISGGMIMTSGSIFSPRAILTTHLTEDSRGAEILRFVRRQEAP